MVEAMTVNLQCEQDFPLTISEVNKLWVQVCSERHWPVGIVTVRCVTPAESQRLNQTYREKDNPTNVLTFSYEQPAPAAPFKAQEHDVALCLSLAKKESGECNMELRDYCAWLIVHALLHATGLDHEKSVEENKQTKKIETKILQANGYDTID